MITAAYCVTFASQRVSLIVIPFCLSVCLSVIPRPTTYHDWSITTKFGRQVYTCPWTCISLFGSPVFLTLGARGKNMQNFAYFQRIFLPLRMWRIVPYDLLCLFVVICHYIDITLVLNSPCCSLLFLLGSHAVSVRALCFGHRICLSHVISWKLSQMGAKFCHLSGAGSPR